MTDDAGVRYGAAAGAVAVLLFVIAALVIGDRPGFDAPGTEVAADFAEHRTRIQVACALNAATAPLLIWFFATVASVARTAGPGAQRAASVAFGCGVAFMTLFLADVTALAVGALRPVSDPDVASALRDFEWLAMGMASLVAAAVLAAYAVLVLRDGAVWPRWLGWLAVIAAPAYALRVGTLFTTDGPFAADGLLGLYVPVAALAGWVLLAGVVLAVGSGRDGSRAS